jgi:hypothetical protein
MIEPCPSVPFICHHDPILCAPTSTWRERLKLRLPAAERAQAVFRCGAGGRFEFIPIGRGLIVRPR